MKTVMFVTGSMRRGGAERVISIISDGFVKAGWKVYIVQLLFPECGYELNPGVERIDISNPEKNQTLDSPRMIIELRKLIDRLEPDTVISFMMTVNIITSFACKGKKVRFIPSERNDPSVGRSWLMDKLVKHAFSTAGVVVMQTERARSYFPRRISDKSVIINNPVAVAELASETKRPRIVNVARLTKQKNQRMLIEAFAAFKDRHPEYSLDIYGEGSARDELQRLINDMGLNNAVTLHGNVQDIHKKIADAEMFVLSSDFEGTSNALIEAMMMGLPCITTDCAGSEETITDHESGLIVRVGDKVGMINAMEFMAGNKEIAARMGLKGSDHVKKVFDTETVCKKWIDVAEGKMDR